MKLLVTLSLALLALGASSVTGEPLKVSIFYMGICERCRLFLTDQVLPTYEALGDSVLNFEFVPETMQETVEDVKQISCEDGPDECYSETIESCVFAADYTQAQKLNFLVCVVNNENPADNDSAQKCAEKYEIEWDPVLECASGDDGAKLLEANSDIMYSQKPVIDSCPFVIFNDDQDADLNTNAKANFLETVCGQLEEKPDACSS